MKSSEEKLTVDRLAQLLKDAEMAHGDYERQLGRSDANWPHWYAEYILEQIPEARWE